MTVLSAPSTGHETRVLNSVILVVSIFSAVGAGWIVLSFMSHLGQAANRVIGLYGLSLRLNPYIKLPGIEPCSRPIITTHLLTFTRGLAISDFWMAINFMSSASMNLAGSPIGSKERKPLCSFNGFMIQVFVVQTDYWVLTIAGCTYLILADHKYQSTWIQDHKYIIWLLPWVLSILWAVLGLVIVGYGDIGAWCWFTSDRVRLLVNFIPRWLIIIAILGLYLRLYFIIHKAHNRFISFDDDTVGSLQASSSTPRNGRRQTFNISSSAEGDNEAERSQHTRIGRASPVLRRISYQMMAYPLVYLLIWTIPTTIRIYQSTANKAAPFAIGTIDKSCIVIQGFADAIVYGFNEHTWSIWRRVFTKLDTKK